MAKIRATATSDFSPPESKLTFCFLLPGTCMSISTPVSSKSFSSVRISSPRPPGKICANTSLKQEFTDSKVSANLEREILLIRAIVLCKTLSEVFKSAICVDKKL
ncbi:hypothetical protein SMITH_186 [Smithella sp. ME-1]|nr:hypothetical protein SMITH_186 [Smithella sp. ME-1]